jgi:hypothetical protein
MLVASLGAISGALTPAVAEFDARAVTGRRESSHVELGGHDGADGR